MSGNLVTDIFEIRDEFHRTVRSAQIPLESGDIELPPLNPCANALPVENKEVQHQLIRDYAHYKRLRELFLGDPEVRSAVARDAVEALSRLNLKLPEKVLQPLQIALADGDGWPFPDLDALVPAPNMSNWRHLARTYPIENVKFRAWKNRQFHRTRGQFQIRHQELIQEIVAAYELSRGCSGACGFCCFDAPPLKEHLAWNKKTKSWWRDTLLVIKRVLGPGAVAAAGYWATDPFDHPEYEAFTSEFQKVNGQHLRTTTLLWDRDLDRVRKFLELVTSSGEPYSFRLSIVSLKQLRLMHENFSPEEMATIRVAVNNRQSLSLYTPTGRARKLQSRKSWQNLFYEGSTSACLSGFLFNLPDRTVKLISPCPPSSRHPKGYTVFCSRKFNQPEDLEIILEDIIEHHMPLAPPPKKQLGFRDDLALEISRNTVRFKTRYLTKQLKNDPMVVSYVQQIIKGEATPSTLRGSSFLQTGSQDHADHFIFYLFENGLLKEYIEPDVSE